MIYVYEPDVMEENGRLTACVKKDGKIIATAPIPDEFYEENEHFQEKMLRTIAMDLIKRVQNMDVADGKTIDL